MAEINEEKKEITQVATGHVKEKGLGEKVAGSLLSEDTRNVKNYIIWDVLIPGIKNAIADMVVGGIEMALFGSTKSRKPSSSYRGGETHVSYRNYYRDDDRSSYSSRMDLRNRSSRNSCNDIVLDNRGDVEEVIMSMEELVHKYGEASVSDLYSLVGISSSFQDNKWGWRDTRDFGYTRSGRGYRLEFNPPIFLGD